MLDSNATTPCARHIPVMVVARDASLDGVRLPAGYSVAGIVRNLEAAAALMPSVSAEVVLVEDGLRQQAGFTDMLNLLRAVFPSLRIEYFARAGDVRIVDAPAPPPPDPGDRASAVPERGASVLEGRMVEGIRGALVLVWAPKGGVGRTFLCCNLSAASVRRGIHPVCVVDLDMGSGDVAVHLDLGDGPTILDALPYTADGSPAILERSVARHRKSGVNVVAAPGRPELSELVKPEDVRLVVEALRQRHSAVFIDTPADSMAEPVYDYLEQAWRIVLVVTQDVACLRRTKAVLELAEKLRLPLLDRIVVVVNRFSEASPVDSSRIESFLGVKVGAVIPEDRRTVEESVYRGVPAVLLAPNENVARAIEDVASRLFGLPAAPSRRLGTVRNAIWGVFARGRLTGGKPA
ncbi:MAG: hypothetical protein HPY55_09025 [Firmicutes bacterium]|nr:hypothetical protein [Bacillota bacterium]